MSCNNCTQTYPIPICAESIELGIIVDSFGEPIQDEFVAYFNNQSSSAVFYTPFETDVS